MPSKFLYVQYTDLGRRTHVCLHSPESCFLRQKKFICLGGTNLACEMMIRRFISVKREKTRSDPNGASQLKAKGILKKHGKKNQTRLQRKEPGDEVKKESPWWMLSAPDPLPLNPSPSPSLLHQICSFSNLQNTERKAGVEREARLSLTSLFVLERTRDFYLSSSELFTDRQLSERNIRKYFRKNFGSMCLQLIRSLNGEIS